MDAFPYFIVSQRQFDSLVGISPYRAMHERMINLTFNGRRILIDPWYEGEPFESLSDAETFMYKQDELGWPTHSRKEGE